MSEQKTDEQSSAVESWAERYDRELRELNERQESLARAIVDRLNASSASKGFTARGWSEPAGSFTLGFDIGTAVFPTARVSVRFANGRLKIIASDTRDHGRYHLNGISATIDARKEPARIASDIMRRIVSQLPGIVANADSAIAAANDIAAKASASREAFRVALLAASLEAPGKVVVHLSPREEYHDGQQENQTEFYRIYGAEIRACFYPQERRVSLDRLPAVDIDTAAKIAALIAADRAREEERRERGKVAG